MTCLAVGVVWAAPGEGRTAQAAPVKWVTGAALQSQLSQPVRCSWPGVPLRHALQSLSRAKHLAVLIDRRVDPSQKLELQLDGIPLRTALQDIADKRGLGVSLLGPVGYFGPARAAARLRTVAALRNEEMRRLPPDVGRKFSRSGVTKWDDYAVPRELLERLGERYGFRIEGLGRVPHDLWAGADLPPLSLADRLTLILVQFDLTFRISPDGSSVTLVPLPDDVALVRSYPGGSRPELTAERYARLAPEAQIKVVGNKVYVKGLLEHHEQIRSPSPPGERPSNGPTGGNLSDQRFTLTLVNKPVLAVFEVLTKRHGFDFHIDHDALETAGISLERLVSCSVSNATIDELLRKVTKPAGLKYTRRGRVVQIGPAE